MVKGALPCRRRRKPLSRNIQPLGSPGGFALPAIDTTAMDWGEASPPGRSRTSIGFRFSVAGPAGAAPFINSPAPTGARRQQMCNALIADAPERGHKLLAPVLRNDAIVRRTTPCPPHEHVAPHAFACRPRVFHAMEKNIAFFPRNGKNVSTPWKNRPRFSTPWKTFFHTVENPAR